jgi:hypothetical protein
MISCLLVGSMSNTSAIPSAITKDWAMKSFNDSSDDIEGLRHTSAGPVAGPLEKQCSGSRIYSELGKSNRKGLKLCLRLPILIIKRISYYAVILIQQYPSITCKGVLPAITILAKMTSKNEYTI